ncbi:hypothetical protein NADFUDRAFT_46177 [Nadsonia fulvescens var. elongata DSM 6958]|uniref:Oxidoreductase-like domain-containing protein n=1 Tax=Nadsonia fulvescens var. elongata DSM 6958 TaxID=857566 RepID=A0A1E3PMZ8_9ASCO|nr:hypothetical protein NADFUDRAFT_46177 [Nadsonia fulvescens var. elongata DSM 6958]
MTVNQKNPDGKISMTFDPLADTYENKVSMEERAKKVFGTPGSREAQREVAGQSVITIAGIKVPPRPLEPENCCGSGCINCVWELFRDELKEWQTARKDAYKNLLKEGKKWPADMGPPPVQKRAKRVFAPSPFDKLSKPVTDKNSPVSKSNESEAVEVEEEEDSWKDVDTSIRAFVENEKRIRARKLQRLKDKEAKDVQVTSS